MLTCLVTLEPHPAFPGALHASSFGNPAPPFPRPSPRSLVARNAFPSPLCFHILTNCFSRSPFPLIFLRIAGGYTPLDDKKFAPISPNSSPINNASRHRQRPSGRRPSAQALLAQANLCYILFLGLDRRRSSLSRGARIVSRESSFGSFDLIDRGLLDTHGYHYGTGRKAQA